MVYLILSKNGYADLKAEIDSSGNSYWVSEEIVSKEEAEEHWSRSSHLTVIKGKINKKNNREIESVLSDISEHHPGETIWIEK